MKILYGVQGTGNGHISRARAIGRYLQDKGADVSYLISGRERDKLFDMQPFGDFMHRKGFTFSTKAGKIQTLPTLLDSNLLRFYKDVRSLPLEDYDVVVTDFEPVTAWAARRAGVKSIGISHQYAFHHDVPKAGETLTSRFLIKNFAPADISFGLHWHHFFQPILPPIIDDQALPAAVEGDSILVYLPFEDQQAVQALLRPFREQHFTVYGPGLGKHDVANLSLRPLSVKGFKQDLVKCRGIICNAGFMLLSEALYLGKKVLVKPLGGQMEQLSNVEALTMLRYGEALAGLDSARIEQWLNQTATFQAIHYPDVAAAFVDWLLGGEWTDESARKLVKHLWETQTPVTEANSPLNEPVCT